LVPRTLLERIVVNHMSRQGLRFEGGSVEEGVLRFVGNGTAYVVKVLDEVGGRPELISAAIQSAFLAAKGERAYILVPKGMASMDEFMAIRLHGIGLLMYGSDGIEEVPPMVRHTEDKVVKDGGEVFVDNCNALHMLERLERLERFVQRIKEVDELASRLERLEALYGELSRRLSAFEEPRPSHIKKFVPDSVMDSVSTGMDLPSFMKDNPWLDILADKKQLNA